MGSRKLIFWHLAGIIVIGCFFWVGAASAANWYVRPSGGSGTGTSWTAAWNGFANINNAACGDTIWVAGGTYTMQLNITKNCTAGSVLSIRRARSDASESTGADGWSPAFDSTVIQTANDAIFLNTGGNVNYITVSGRTTASGGTNGWYINLTAGGVQLAGIKIDHGSGRTVTHNTFEYIDIQGPGNVFYDGGGNGIDQTPYQSTCNNNTFSHIKIWNMESAIYSCYCDDVTFEYLDISDIMCTNWDCAKYPGNCYHPNGIYTCGSNRYTIRYSVFHAGAHDQAGEGILMNGGDGWMIYGNVFYDLSDSTKKALEFNNGGLMTNMKIFNNTFDNVANPGYLISGGGCGSGSENRNNLYYNSGNITCGTASNNLSVSTTAIWSNRAGHDYNIVGTVASGFPRNAGYDVSAYFTTDAYGTIFGGDGAWDIGAYEYRNTAVQPPGTPSGLQVR